MKQDAFSCFLVWSKIAGLSARLQRPLHSLIEVLYIGYFDISLLRVPPRIEIEDLIEAPILLTLYSIAI